MFDPFIHLCNAFQHFTYRVFYLMTFFDSASPYDANTYVREIINICLIEDHFLLALDETSLFLKELLYNFCFSLVVII